MIASDFLDKRLLRVYISSTLMDMQDERNYLTTRVFPALIQYCKERLVSFFPIDLRWGITDEEARLNKELEIVLREIINAKPFFIGILGESYGWIPSEAQRMAMAENTFIFHDFPWIEGELLKGTSVTEIEMQEAAFRSEEKMHAYFYLRSSKMETPKEFTEKEGSHRAEKLMALKKKIREQKRYPAKEYDSVEHLGELVENDFKALINELFPLPALSS